MDRAGFETLLERLGDAWECGDAQAAADCLAVEIDPDGAITRWREWQHLDDVSDWNAYQQGAGG